MVGMKTSLWYIPGPPTLPGVGGRLDGSGGVPSGLASFSFKFIAPNGAQSSRL